MAAGLTHKCIFKILFVIYIYMSVWPAYLCTCTCSTSGGQKRSLDLQNWSSEAYVQPCGCWELNPRPL